MKRLRATSRRDSQRSLHSLTPLPGARGPAASQSPSGANAAALWESTLGMRTRSICPLSASNCLIEPVPCQFSSELTRVNLTSALKASADTHWPAGADQRSCPLSTSHTETEAFCPATASRIGRPCPCRARSCTCVPAEIRRPSRENAIVETGAVVGHVATTRRSTTS